VKNEEELIKRKAGVMKEGRMTQRMEHRLRPAKTTG
jgi:hypothetical protein